MKQPTHVKEAERRRWPAIIGPLLAIAALLLPAVQATPETREEAAPPIVTSTPLHATATVSELI